MGQLTSALGAKPCFLCASVSELPRCHAAIGGSGHGAKVYAPSNSRSGPRTFG
jgi:hypothetical protein